MFSDLLVFRSIGTGTVRAPAQSLLNLATRDFISFLVSLPKDAALVRPRTFARSAGGLLSSIVYQAQGQGTPRDLAIVAITSWWALLQRNGAQDVMFDIVERGKMGSIKVETSSASRVAGDVIDQE